MHPINWVAWHTLGFGGVASGGNSLNYCVARWRSRDYGTYFTGNTFHSSLMFCWPCVSIYLCNKNYLSSLYFGNQLLNVSGIFVAHHQELYCIYTSVGTCCAFQLTVCLTVQQTVNWKTQHVPICCIYTVYSWWWATNMPETFRGWLPK
jgi:hypothetical protein